MIVRSVLVTAINLDLGSKTWWPSTLDQGEHADAPPEPSAEPERQLV
jgi:RND superfamily putative drug exporter